MYRSILLIMVLVMMTGGSAAAGATLTSTPKFKAASSPNRTIIVISDLHMGPGKRADDSWYPMEDFRWPNAFKAFLDEISKSENSRVDLIIAGDLLDMWQPAPDKNIGCEGDGGDLGCTVEDMQKIASSIATAHDEEFKALRQFSEKGENRLHIIPGNHDAALLIDSVWQPVGDALNADGGRVNFASTGVWMSADGRIVVEHGHQIGNDANRYDKWPDILRTKDGKEYVICPFGERFVRKIFNEQEEIYQIIDNLSPESAGVVYRIVDQGEWGTTSDMATFVAFVFFQASRRQQIAFVASLGSEDEGEPEWDIQRARKNGHRLFLAALPEDDGLSKLLIEDSEQAKQLRGELDLLARDKTRFPDENVEMLCDQAAICGNSAVCETELLGERIEVLLLSKRRILAPYLRQRKAEFPKMVYFVYGHTHDLDKEPWPISKSSEVKVLNSGAFQRSVDDVSYLHLVSCEETSAAEGLRKISLEKLPPCYSFVRIPYLQRPEVRKWFMDEAEAKGRIVEPRDADWDCFKCEKKGQDKASPIQ